MIHFHVRSRSTCSPSDSCRMTCWFQMHPQDTAGTAEHLFDLQSRYHSPDTLFHSNMYPPSRCSVQSQLVKRFQWDTWHMRTCRVVCRCLADRGNSELLQLRSREQDTGHKLALWSFYTCFEGTEHTIHWSGWTIPRLCQLDSCKRFRYS